MLFDLNRQKIKLNNRVCFVFCQNVDLFFYDRQTFKTTNFITIVNRNVFMKKKKYEKSNRRKFHLKISSFELNFNLFRSFYAKKSKH